MSAPSRTELLAFLEQSGLLSAPQAQQLTGSNDAALADVKALVRELVGRNWLTGYQANQLLKGEGEGLVLGPFRLLDRLGEGGMGEVFRAYHVSMGRVVALKIIPEARVSNATAVARFYREVRAVATLSHPNIVTAFEVGQAGQTHFLAMEHVDGIDLARLVQQSGPLSIAMACEYVRQAAVGLQHAHEKGLVHRDIKPGNLMVARPSPDEPPVVKILDFGLARFESESTATERLTQLGKIVGTVDYMAPEQAQNPRTADIRADIYSLGCTLFYLLTGEAPFRGDDAAEKIAARVLGDAPSVREARPEVPPALERVLARMMARDPAERYQTPGEVAKALEPHTRDDKQVRAAAPAADRPVAPEPAAPARSPWDFDREGGGGVRRPPRRGVPGWVWLAGGAAALVVVVVVVLVVRIGSRPKTPDGPPVAAKGPGGDDRPKDADKAKDTDPDRKKDKKDKTDTPEKPASAKLPEPLPTTWRSLASMPTARSLLAAVTGPDGRIYAIGGENASGRLGTVEVYDPSTNKWTTVAPMPTARNHLAATMGPDNLIYAIGGVSVAVHGLVPLIR
jgi:serine/threonine-protein kinase